MPTIGKHSSKAIGLGLVFMLIASTSTAGTIGQKRCMMLDKQLVSVTHSAKASTPKSVGDLAEKAQTLCSNGKTAQGLRAYARALKIMGSQPVFPSEQPQRQRIKS